MDGSNSSAKVTVRLGRDTASVREVLGAPFKLLVALAALCGVGIQLAVSMDPRGKLNLLSYYTIQTNLIVGLLFIVSATGKLRGRPASRITALLERSARVWVLMTGLGFFVLLSRTWRPEGILALSNLLLHYAVPGGALLSWLLFEPKGTCRLGDLPGWLGYPLLYAAFCLLRGGLDGFYPYWFINPVRAMPDGVGSLAGALGWIGTLAIAFLLLGLALTGIDALSAKAQKARGA